MSDPILVGIVILFCHQRLYVRSAKNFRRIEWKPSFRDHRALLFVYLFVAMIRPKNSKDRNASSGCFSRTLHRRARADHKPMGLYSLQCSMRMAGLVDPVVRPWTGQYR